MQFRETSSNAFPIIASLALAFSFSEINLPLKAVEAPRIVQRQIIPAQVPLAAALQNAATLSSIKLMVGGDGTESSLLHQPEILTIWIGRQTHDTSVL